tara:strand:+ start:668 stop:1315 length:648 start_codon:yes stop_codon:yes gene_type:complete
MSSNTANRSRHPWLSSVRLAGLSVLALVTALTLTIEGDDPRPDPDNRDLVSTLQPSSTATGVTWQVFSDQGKLDYDVSAKQLEQYPSQQLMKAANPIVRMASQEKYPWVLRADRGVITRRRDTLEVADQYNQMTLQGHVQILRQSDTAKKQMMLSTSQLHIFPTEQRAQTDMPVFLEHERFTTSSEGFDLDLETGALIFAQNAHARVTSKLFLRD